MLRRRILLAGASTALASVVREARADNFDGAACEPRPAWDHVVVLWGPNHGHELVVPAEHVRAQRERAYVITGKSDHDHVIRVTRDDFADLSAGDDVRLASTKTGGHLHRVRLRCSPAVTPPAWISACEVQVGGNDGHEVIVTRADLDARSARTYDIRGVAPHTHALVLERAHFDALAAGSVVRVTTGPGDGHTHLVAILPPKKA